MKQEKIEVSEDQYKPILMDLYSLYKKHHNHSKEKESTIIFIAALRLATKTLEEVLFEQSGFVFGKIEAEEE
jgi:hypothetical protein